MLLHHVLTVEFSGTVAPWRTTAGASTDSPSGTIDSREIREIKVSAALANNH